MDVVFVDVSRLCRLGSIAYRVCFEIVTQHDRILVNLKMSVYEMHAEHVPRRREEADLVTR